MIKFTLPIIPTPQARPKVAVRGRFANAYKTEAQKANERTLEAWLKDYAPDKPLTGPLILEFIAALPVPNFVSKKRRAAMLAGQEYPVKRPDLSNLEKQIEDAMTRLKFWQDDSQVVCAHTAKIYAETGFWYVAIRAATRETVMLPHDIYMPCESLGAVQ